MKVGILGGGQLGRMLALAGHPLGLTFRILDPAPDACARGVAEHHIGRYDDPEALDRFTDGLDLVTFEFENIPPEAVESLSARLPVRPGALSLRTGADRVLERRAFERVGLATPRWAPVERESDLAAALAHVGTPCLIKSRRGGYDGRGQARIETPDAAPSAWAALGNRPAILDQLIPFARELSLVGARGLRGETAFYPLVENTHRKGILWRTRAPAAGIDAHQAFLARHAVTQIMTMLDHVGALAVEFFDTGDGLLANETAPRVHNTGHWTIEGAVTSQFENHLRAVAGWPLGDPSPRGESVMLNLIGRMPRVADVLSRRGLHLHDYAKRPAPGRKLGHLTCTGEFAADIAASIEPLVQPLVQLDSGWA